MPPRPKEFAVLCVLLVALHAGAAGLLWVEGGSVAAPAAETADASAGAETLLFAAAHNDAVLPMTSELRLSHPENGTTVTRASVAADPRAGRVRLRASVRRSATPFAVDEAYVTPWGRWDRVGDDWRYDGSREARFETTTPRFFFPNPDRADRVQKTVHGNGTVTVRLEGARASPGPLAFAGDDATLTYRIAFDDGRPYVVRATGHPTDGDGLVVTVDRRRGADVSRPAALPPATPRGVRDRVVAGGFEG